VTGPCEEVPLVQITAQVREAVSFFGYLDAFSE
jgi:hypothetical protein